MLKITIAMMRKSTRVPKKCPIESMIGPIVIVASLHAPPGMKNVIMGIIMSDTSADTKFPAAPPIITAIARPITPYLLKNAINSFMKPCGAGGDGGSRFRLN